MSIGSPDSTVGIEDHPASAEPVRAATVAHGKSPTRIAVDRLRKDKVAVICVCIVLFFVLVAIFAPLLAKLEGGDVQTFHPELVDEFGFPTIGITPDHWFGVEPKTGRDNFARWVYGARHECTNRYRNRYRNGTFTPIRHPVQSFLRKTRRHSPASGHFVPTYDRA